MSKFNVGDKVKIPKTKLGKTDYNFKEFEDELKISKFDHLIIDQISMESTETVVALRGPKRAWLKHDKFYESDLELYEETYTLKQLFDNKIAVICDNKKEALKLAIKIKSTNNEFDFYVNAPYVILPTTSNEYSNLDWVGGFTDVNYLVENGFSTKNINFSQIDFEETNTKTENMKVKKYKLVKTKYTEAFYNITGLEGKTEFEYGSIAYERLVEAGVLDLWCEEVPDTIKLYDYEVKKHNGGYKIGCKFITFQQLQSLKYFIEKNGFVDVSFGSYHITLEEINSILAL